MRFLVTGGSGFIGSHLVERLVADGQDVTVLDDFSSGIRANIEPFLSNIRLIEGSILDRDVCRDAIQNIDFVLHQAALGSVPRSIVDPLLTHEVNATGTLNLLMAANDAKVKRFVYAGSSSAYGNTTQLPKHEQMQPQPRSPYAVAKLSAEHYLAAFYATYGLETVTLRYFNVFGPRQDPNSQYAAVIPRFMVAAFMGASPVIFGDGEQTRDFTYVSNVVDANLLACGADAERVAGRVFNIGGGKQTTLNELWRQISRLAGTTASPTYGAPRTGDVRDSLASLTLASANLGYEVRTNFPEGLAATVESFRASAATTVGQT